MEFVTETRWINSVSYTLHVHLGGRCVVIRRLLLSFALIGLLLVVLKIEIVVIDVLDDLVGDIVADALAALPEQTDLG